MLYFAYGSNMEKAQMQQRCPNHKFFSVARLDHYILTFTRYSDRWEGGVADLLPERGKVVHGVLYDISLVDLKLLDQYTGYPNCYMRGDLILETTSGERLPAMTYFAVRQGVVKPSRRYMDQVLKGARSYHLPKDYINFLKSIQTQD
jgi:cation transport regulator ChaC